MLTAGGLLSSSYSCDKLLSTLPNTLDATMLSVIVCPALPIRVQLTLSQIRLSIISKLLHPSFSSPSFMFASSFGYLIAGMRHRWLIVNLNSADVVHS